MTISDNTSKYIAALAGASNINLTNVTISDNHTGYGGNFGGSSNPMTLTLKNTLIANVSSNCAFIDSISVVISLGHNLSSDNTCPLTATGDLTNTNPLIGPLQDNGGDTLTNALLFGSPAIDAGDNNGCPPTDQRGFTRVGPCDIGAYEATLKNHEFLPLAAR